MIYINNKTAKGYLHDKEKLPCQDYSLSYKDTERAIISVCDGHGGKVYVRSKIGSELACNAVLNVFKGLEKSDRLKFKDEGLLAGIKLAILCEWNRLVERHLSKHPLRKSELKNLDEDQVDSLKINPVRAYGTTLTGAVLLGDKVLVIGIGDSEAITLKKGEISRVFDDNNDPVGNITYSMCQEDAFKYMKIKALNLSDIDGLILCTDGVTSPYQSYDNFAKSFAIPLMHKIVNEKDFSSVDFFIDTLGSKTGIGDDVSLAYMIDSKTIRKYYK